MRKILLLLLIALISQVGRAEIDPTSHLLYSIIGSEATIDGLDPDFQPDAGFALVIPDMIDGVPVTAIGPAAFIDNKTVGSIVVGRNIKTIGNEAFRRATTITSVTFSPDGCLESIGESAFRGCTELKEFDMPNTVTTIGAMCLQANAKLSRVSLSNSLVSIASQALCNCPMLTEIEIPASVSSISDRAFWQCSGLLEISIPATVSSLASNAFEQCSALQKATLNCPTIPAGILNGLTQVTQILLGHGVKSIGANAFSQTSITEITIPNTVNSIGNAAFQNCTSLESINFADSIQLTTIPSYAFDGCTQLDGVTLPPTVQVLSTGAFRGCSALTDMNILSGVNKLESNVFENCTSMRNVNFAEGINLEVIASSSFRHCDSLEQVNIPASVKRIEASAFQLSGIRRVNFAENPVVEFLGESAFRGCARLTEFNMPNSVKTTGQMCLQANATLSHVTLSDSLTAIAPHLLCNCPMLTEIEIPASVNNIDNRAFWLCSGLVEVTIPHSVTSMGIEVFRECSSLTLINLSACSDMWALYPSSTDIASQLAIPTGVRTLIPPYALATGNGVEPIDINFDLSQDSEGFYLVGSANDLDKLAAFARANPNINARLTADVILTGKETKFGIGPDQNNHIAFTGIFDGAGHRITLNFTNENKITFPYGTLFTWADNASFRNLAIDGEIQTSAGKTSSLVGGTTDTIAMRECLSEARITGIVKQTTDMHLGSLIGYTYNSDITLDDCMAGGTIAGGEFVHYCSDLIGRVTNGTKITFNNCLAMESYDVSLPYVGRLWLTDSNNPSENFSGVNNYIVHQDGVSTGDGIGTTIGANMERTKVNMEQIADGTVANGLQAERQNQIWVQDPVRHTPMLHHFANTAISGDITGDGKVDVNDLNLLINILLGISPATDAANVDKQGGIDVQDVNTLINIILGR